MTDQELEKILLYNKLELAQNPNTSKDILRVLIHLEFKGIGSNVLQNPNCPEDVLIEYSDNEDNELKALIASNPNCPPKILKKLAKENDREIKKAIAKNHHCPDYVLEMIYEDVKELVLQNINCPLHYLEESANSIDILLKKAVASNPKCPPDILRKLFKEYRVVQEAVVNNLSCPEDILEYCANSNIEYLKYPAIKNPNCPRKLLEIFSDNLDEKTRISVTENPNCQEGILKKLCLDLSLKVRKSAILNHNFPKDYLIQLLLDKNEDIALTICSLYNSNNTIGLIENEKLEPELLEFLFDVAIKNKNYRVFKFFTKNSNCPESVLSTIIDLYINNINNERVDENYSILKAVEEALQHKNLSKDYIDKMFSNMDELPLTNHLNLVLKNPNCSPELLKRYIDNIYDLNINTYLLNNILKNIFSNPNCPPEIMMEIIDRNSEEDILYLDEEVIEAILNNPNCSSEIVNKLMYDFGCEVEVLRSPNCTPEILEYYSKNVRSQWYYKIIFLNPNSNNNIKYNCLEGIDPLLFPYLTSIPKEYLSLFELGVRTDNIEKYKDSFYYLFFTLLSSKGITNKVITKEMKDIINNKILDPDFPEEVLYYYFINPSFSFYFSQEALEKIREIGIKAEKSLVDGYKYKDYYLLKIKHNFINTLNQEEKKIEEDEHLEAHKHNSSIEVDVNGTVTLKFLSERDIFDKSTIEYGFFPQKEVNLIDKKLLDYLSDTKQIFPSSSSFTIVHGLIEKKYPVYFLENRKFIKYNDTWIEVLPIKWRVKTKISSTMKYYYDITLTADYLTPRIFGRNVHINKNTFARDFFEHNTSKVQKFDDKELDSLPLSVEEKLIKGLERIINERKEEKEKVKEKSEKDALIESIYLRKLEIAKEREEIRAKREELQRQVGLDKKEEHKRLKTEQMIYTKELIDVDRDVLFKKVDDHFEINPVLLPFLKYIRLSGFMTDNLKVSGLDLSESNLDINPQTVYMKDLSNTKLSSSNLSEFALDFEGCNLCGADLSEVHYATNYYGNLEEAIIDEKTKLPKGYKKPAKKL